VSQTHWSKADLHIHSILSDGGNTIRDILAHAATATQMDVIAITDHDRIDGAQEAQQLGARYGLDVIVGEEVTARQAHVLAYFLRERVASGMSIAETTAAIHEQGGIAVLAHPYDRVCPTPISWRHRPTSAEWRGFGLDGIEGLNGSQVDPTSNPKALALGARLGHTMTGGSDAHHKEVIGRTYTLFPGVNAADLHVALLNHKTLPAGQGWSLRDYAGWARKAFLPRVWRAVGMSAACRAAQDGHPAA